MVYGESGWDVSGGAVVEVGWDSGSVGAGEAVLLDGPTSRGAVTSWLFTFRGAFYCCCPPVGRGVRFSNGKVLLITIRG